MTQHGQIRHASVWDMRANEFELRLRNILTWARQKGAEAQGGSIDLRTAAALPGVAIAFDRRLRVLGGDGANAFDLTAMPDELAAPLRTYVEETGGYDPALPVDRQSSHPITYHSYVLANAGRGLAERRA